MPDGLWRTLEDLADRYEGQHGVRPNQMRVGGSVAQALEPDRGAHPVHTRWQSPVRGVWFPVRPDREHHWWDQLLRQRSCKKNGGHFWHPADPMIAWFCCRCGADRDGMPKDGT